MEVIMIGTYLRYIREESQIREAVQRPEAIVPHQFGRTVTRFAIIT